MVRVDFFKESGKWYTTEEMEMIGGFDKTTSIHEAFIKSLGMTFPENYHEFIAVCLEPYHENSHPLMVMNWYNKYLAIINKT